jgi:hypothetical protein
MVEMAGGFMICEYESVRKNLTPFAKVMADCRNEVIDLATKDWSPLKFGGLFPRAGEFGETPVMPALFRDMGNNTLATWLQWFTSTGHQTIMSGANGGNLYRDYKVGLVGLVFLDKAIRVSEIKMQVSDKKLPRVNLEEAMAYNKPAVVFEDSLLLDEQTGFDLYAYVLSQGYQRIKLLGVQLNRVPNKLQTTACGAALT